jgi:hypothetical protein
LSTLTKQSLSDAIDEYEKAANESIKGLTRANWLIDMAYVAVTVALIIVSAIWSNISGIATTSGVSGVTLLSQAKTSADASKVYNQDRNKLQVSVHRLREALKLCDDTDQACLENVKKLIDDAFTALGDAAKH